MMDEKIEGESLTEEKQSQDQQDVSMESAYEYAGFGERAIAMIIDSILIGVMQSIIMGIFTAVLGAAGVLFVNPETATNEAPAGFIAVLLGGTVLIILVSMTISYGYFVFLTGYKGATIGKMIMKLEVVDEDYQRVSYSKAFVREVIGKMIEGFIFFLGYFLVLFDEQKQSLHDKIAKTYVIKKS